MNFRIYLITTMLLCVTNAIMAQDYNLIGTWHLDMNKALTVMDPKYKLAYDSLPVDIKDRVVNRIDGREFIFSETCYITVNWKSDAGPHVSEGQWIKNHLQSELLVTIDNTKVEYNFEFLSANVLVMKSKNQRGVFDTLYLVRVN